MEYIFIVCLPSLAQSGDTALLLAAYDGGVQMVRMLLEGFNSSLDEVNDVSVYLCTLYVVCIHMFEIGLTADPLAIDSVINISVRYSVV